MENIKGIQCVREEVSLASEYASKIQQGFIDSFLLDKNLIFNHWEVIRIEMLENSEFEEEYLSLREVFKNREYGVEETVSNYGFLAAANDAPVNMTLQQGLRCKMCPINALGYCISGVSLCVHGDVCVQEAATLEDVGQNMTTLLLMVFKFMYGRRNAVVPSNGLHIIPPTPGFDSHISIDVPTPSDSIAKQHHRSMVYLYEFENELYHPMDRPRHCCPLAAIYLKRRVDPLFKVKSGVGMVSPVASVFAPKIPYEVSDLVSMSRVGTLGRTDSIVQNALRTTGESFNAARKRGLISNFSSYKSEVTKMSRTDLGSSADRRSLSPHPYARNQQDRSHKEVEESKKREEEERKKRVEEEERNRQRAEEERKRRVEEERKMKAEEEQKKRIEEEQRKKRVEEERKRRDEEVRLKKLADEAAEMKRRREEERIRLEKDKVRVQSSNESLNRPVRRDMESEHRLEQRGGKEEITVNNREALWHRMMEKQISMRRQPQMEQAATDRRMESLSQADQTRKLQGVPQRQMHPQQQARFQPPRPMNLFNSPSTSSGGGLGRGGFGSLSQEEFSNRMPPSGFNQNIQHFGRAQSQYAFQKQQQQQQQLQQQHPFQLSQSYQQNQSSNFGDNFLARQRRF